MIWQCWLARAFSSTRAQEDSCPTTLHINTDCSICKSFFQQRSLDKRHRKSSAPECRDRPRRASQARISTHDPKLCLSNGGLLNLQEESGRHDIHIDDNISEETSILRNSPTNIISTPQTSSSSPEPTLIPIPAAEKLKSDNKKGLRRSVSFSGKSLCYKY
eukprot:TRINITY_DN30509_c0_g1_i1.p1 TRINITY_DN30509_c0_g1~~TRINITY_DN30509_c0_g1_i1.p1  ORF type:complete len:161 (+),score=35.19 TRINITY_DN30509_c0_g1_i1:1-483(+)